MVNCPNRITLFNGVTQYGDTLLASELEQNLKIFLDWAFLEIGAFTNVAVNQLGGFGGDFSKLRLVDDPSYTLGQVWETVRKDWVYETGISYSGTSPHQISGVFVNTIFRGSGDPSFSHYYDYPLGRLIFNSPINQSSSVKLKYSFRNVQVYKADDAPWWTELQYRTFRPDDSHFDLTGSGDWAILSNHRVQLPAIVLEVVPRRRFQPYELGNLTQWVHQDLLFHVLAESRWERNQVMDILSFQNDKTIWLFDSNTVADSGVFPLDFRGMFVGGLMYPDLVETPYRWKKCQFTKTVVSEVHTFNPRLHEATIRTTLLVLWADIC